MGLSVLIPHHTSPQNRAAELEVSNRVGEVRGTIDLVANSTELKVPGGGEWKVRQHGTEKKRRTWRKVHLAVDPKSHTIVAHRFRILNWFVAVGTPIAIWN